MNQRMKFSRSASTAMAALVACCAVAEPAPADDMADLSLEQLGAIRISSVSRRTERLQDAAASVFVISADQIRRSGARTLPDALRLAPNLHVAQSAAASHVIAARGLNGAGNKMLVLLDGRILYTPLYSGVLWDAQDVMLEDVERIEVISGPGGTLWGSNAVNGVINITTRNAQATQGTLAILGAGGGETYATVRHGGKLGENGHFRLYGRAIERPGTRRANGVAAEDDWVRQQIGFRADWGQAGEGLTLQGDAYQGRFSQVSPLASQTLSGFNLLTRWSHRLQADDQLQIQAYIDQTERKVPGVGGDLFQRLKIADIGWTHNLQARGGHTVVWGGGYRHARDHLRNPVNLAFLPAQKTLQWANLFVQDEIALRPDLSFTAGIKVERNPYTGIEFLPSARLAWKPSADQLLWGAVSRAVRTPSRLDRDLYAPATPMPAPLPPFVIAGGPQVRSEVSKVIELGWRTQPTPDWSYSVTAFHHRYEHLRSLETINDPAYAAPYRVVSNQMAGHATGLEAWGKLQVNKWWALGMGASTLRQRLHMLAGSTDPTGVSAAGNDPRYQLMLRSSMDLPANTELQIGVRRIGALPNPAVPGYTAVDARLGWSIHPQLQLALTVQNLFDRRHVEFGRLPAASEIRRQAFVSVTWKL